MITVKKDAIKVKDADGNMQSTGILTQLGGFGDGYGGSGNDWINYISGVSFETVTFPDGTELDINIPNYTGSMLSFREMYGVKKIKVSTPNKDVLNNVTNMFMTSHSKDSLEEIDLSEFALSFKIATNLFMSNNVLKTIIGELDFSPAQSTTNAFNGCALLENVTLKKDTVNVNISFHLSPLLTDDSVQSIIDGLATVETAQTLTLNAKVKAKLTDEQIATITSKNWTLA